jgi:integrase
LLEKLGIAEQVKAKAKTTPGGAVAEFVAKGARGLTLYRPPGGIERLYHADCSETIWEATHIALFHAWASEPLQRALVLALETGQRQGDLLALPWSAYDGTWIRLGQSKAGRCVNIPVTRRLWAMLENSPRTARRDPDQQARHGMGAECLPQGVGRHLPQSQYHRIAFPRPARHRRDAAGRGSHAEIASITGHSVRDVGAILDKYLARTDKIALAAIAKLERGQA